MSSVDKLVSSLEAAGDDLPGYLWNHSASPSRFSRHCRRRPDGARRRREGRPGSRSGDESHQVGSRDQGRIGLSEQQRQDVRWLREQPVRRRGENPPPLTKRSSRCSLPSRSSRHLVRAGFGFAGRRRPQSQIIPDKDLVCPPTKSNRSRRQTKVDPAVMLEWNNKFYGLDPRMARKMRFEADEAINASRGPWLKVSPFRRFRVGNRKSPT